MDLFKKISKSVCNKLNNSNINIKKVRVILILILMLCLILTLNTTTVGNVILKIFSSRPDGASEINKDSKLYKFFRNKIVITMEVILFVILTYTFIVCG